MKAAGTTIRKAFDTQAHRPGVTALAPMLAVSLLFCLSAIAEQLLIDAGVSLDARDSEAILPFVLSETRSTGTGVRQPDPHTNVDHEDEEEECS